MVRFPAVYIGLIVLVSACSDEGMEQSLRSVKTPTQNGVVLTNTSTGNYEFSLSLPAEHEDMSGKAFDVSSYLNLSSRRISIECREGAKRETGSRIIVMLKEMSADRSVKTEVVNFDYICGEGVVAKLTNLDATQRYQLRVLVLNRRGLIYKGLSEVFASTAQEIKIQMLRVKQSDDDSVMVDIQFPSEPVVEKAEAKDTQVTCVFNTMDEVREQSVDGNLARDTVVNRGSCKLTPVKRVAFEDSSEVVRVSPSGACLGGASCDMSLGLVYPDYYHLEINAGNCSRSAYIKMIPGQAIKVEACHP